MTKATFRNRAVQAELSRILRREIRKIIGCLRGLSAATPDGIVRVKQRFRRLQALNQLMEPAHRSTYRLNDRFYRGLVAMLDADSNQQLLHSALQTILFERPDLARDAVTRFLLEFCAGQGKERQQFTTEVWQRLDEHLSAERYAPPSNFGEPELFAGVRANYCRCRRLGKKVLAKDSSGSLIRWNYRVENHFYQTGALHCSTEGMVQRQRDAGKLSEVLNRDYHLALLREQLRQVKQDNPQRLLDAIVDERQLCRLEMETLGEQLFAAAADSFMEQLQAAWSQRWT